MASASRRRFSSMAARKTRRRDAGATKYPLDSDRVVTRIDSEPSAGSQPFFAADIQWYFPFNEPQIYFHSIELCFAAGEDSI